MLATSVGRRRERGRRSLTALARLLLASAVALLMAPSALASSGMQCAHSKTYGSSCIDITGTAGRVQDVQAYFAPPNNDYLSGRRWAIRLAKYRCDPIGRTRVECPADKGWYTRLRHGNPPKQGSLCAQFAPYGIGFQQCENYGVSYADAHFGDFHGFSVPRTYRQKIWLCTEIAVRVRRHWRFNGAPGTPGVRGCAYVKP
jgi:hypothetical protein